MKFWEKEGICYEKGQHYNFLALILSLLLSLVCTSIESVRMAAARTQILSGLDIGLYSLFGQYDRELLKEYDLFFLNGSGSSGTLNLAAVYDNLESYMKPVLKQNSQKLSIVQEDCPGIVWLQMKTEKCFTDRLFHT